MVGGSAQTSQIEDNYEIPDINYGERTYDQLKFEKCNSLNKLGIKPKVMFAFAISCFISAGVGCLITIYATRYNGTDGEINDNITNSMDHNSFSKEGPLLNIKMLKLPIYGNSCPFEWRSFGIACYKLFEDKRNWPESLSMCQILGAELVSIHGRNETNFLNEHFKETYWIGLNDIHNTGSLSWSDNTAYDYMNWRTYVHVEPNNRHNNEQCVHSSSNPLGSWNDLTCYVPLKYVCKMRRTEKCGNGPWLYFNSSCYIFNKDMTIGWNESQQYCINMNSDLAIIHSRDEYNFILSQTSRSGNRAFWIGLYNPKKDFYEWIDGTLPTFTPWDTSQRYGIGYRCVSMLIFYGYYKAEPCYEKHGFVCEKNAEY